MKCSPAAGASKIKAIAMEKARGKAMAREKRTVSWMTIVCGVRRAAEKAGLSGYPVRGASRVSIGEREWRWWWLSQLRVRRIEGTRAWVVDPAGGERVVREGDEIPGGGMVRSVASGSVAGGGAVTVSYGGETVILRNAGDGPAGVDAGRN